MRETSSDYSANDLPRFFDEIFEWDVRHTRERLRAASARMNQLVAGIPETPRGAGEWNAKEVLAHIAVLSKAYGVFGYFIASGRLTDLALGDVINQRDAEGDKYMAMTCAEIAAEATTQHARTLKFLDNASTEDLRRECTVEGGTITAEYVVRLPLVAHLEQHVVQLEQALA
ncbi:MAG TPA: DinB family protein [Candidatus Dormibacteraeota bacterium]|nr:DinB family protein [Candidatus Dormibacteraeota bacterium]